MEVVLTTETIAPSVELQVFPNPVTHTLNIRTGPSSDAITVQLFDLNGRVLLESQMDEFNKELSMDFKRFQEGVYLLKVIQAEAFNTYKIIKNK